MTGWLFVGLLGGLIGLDATSFPQVMVSRPIIAGTLTGAVFGRPMEGLAIGFVLEAFALLVLPIGAARYPESGTATVAATSAYLAVAPAGLHPGMLALVVAFGLAWEWVGGETVVLLRRGNGQIMVEAGGVAARDLERRHLTAMALDFVRGGVVAVTGGLIASGLLQIVGSLWGLGSRSTLAVLAVLTAAMVGTAVPLFGGIRARRFALILGLGVGLVMAVVLP
jgi:mannose/fructose/N-acetylgalactosamine-specific phosphotransferase system component IIC